MIINQRIENKKIKRGIKMKKLLNTFLVLLSVLIAFTACSMQESLSEELVSVSLTSSSAARSLIADVGFEVSMVNSWKYTATKADKGFTKGQTGLGLDNAEDLIDGETQLLSQGSWNFVLYGYDKNNNLICQGSVENATVTATKHSVAIYVQPIKTSGVNGTISISKDIIINGADGVTTYSTGNGGYTITAKVYKGNYTSDSKLVKNGTAESDDAFLYTVEAGLYNVVIEFTAEDGDGTSYTVATASKLINVFDNLTTNVSGTLVEGLYAANLSGEEGVESASFTKTNQYPVSKTELVNKAIDMTVASTPNGAGDNTVVSFPQGAFTLNSYEKQNYVLTVTSSSIETASDDAKEAGYTVASGNSVVAALDFYLTSNGEEINNFAEDKAVTITTYIAKGLVPNEIKVVYVGTNEGKDPEFVSYNQETGELVFNVYHFSEYVVVLPYTPVYDYTSFVTALKKNGDITLINDITLGSNTLNSNSGKTNNINLNGHTISADSVAVSVTKGKLEFSGAGAISTTSTAKSLIEVVPNAAPTTAVGSTTLTIGTDVTLQGGLYGIQINGYNNGVNANGAVITMSGKITGANGGVYINGKVNKTDTSAPTINFEGAEINATNVGIYAAGYANWNIQGDTKITSGTALSLKSGTFTIENGTFKSTGTPADSITDVTTDSGNSGVVTGAALSMTSNDSYTKTLSVTVKGGTFESENGYAVYEGIPYKSGSTTDKVATASYVTLDIQGGTFTGNSEKAAINLTEMTNKNVIKGGTFSSDPTTYLVSGYAATKDEGTNSWAVGETTANSI